MLTVKDLREKGAQIQKRLEADVQRCIQHLPPQVERQWEAWLDESLLRALSDVRGQPANLILKFVVQADGGGILNVPPEVLRQLGLAPQEQDDEELPSNEAFWIAHQVFLHWLSKYKQASGLDIAVSTHARDSEHPLLEVSHVTVKLYKI